MTMNTVMTKPIREPTVELPARQSSRPGFGSGLHWLLRISDLTVLVTGFAVATWVRRGPQGLEVLWHPMFAVGMLFIMLCLYVADSYHLDRRQHRMQPVIRALAALGVAGLALSLAVYLFGPELLRGEYGPVGRTVVVLTLVISALPICLTRLAARRLVEASILRSRWLVVGQSDNPCLQRFNSLFASGNGPGELHFLDDGSTSEESDAYYDRFEQMLTRHWSGVVILEGWNLPDRMIERLMHARLAGLRVYDLSDFYEFCWMKVPVHHLHHGWFAFSTGFPLLHDRQSARMKRMFDIAAALVLLSLSFPLMMLAWTLVRLESRGPGLYSQRRVGMGGHPFTVYKFRSMRQDAEVQGAVWATKNDPRVTRFGRFMRITRIDELPQLFNVLWGEMSFIGPRPERPEFTVQLESQIPFYALRHLVRPGLTGWAQVNYSYGSTIDDSREKLEYDLYYLKNHTFLLDLIIVFRTVKVVLFGRGAR